MEEDIIKYRVIFLKVKNCGFESCTNLCHQGAPSIDQIDATGESILRVGVCWTRLWEGRQRLFWVPRKRLPLEGATKQVCVTLSVPHEQIAMKVITFICYVMRKIGLVYFFEWICVKALENDTRMCQNFKKDWDAQSAPPYTTSFPREILWFVVYVKEVF